MTHVLIAVVLAILAAGIGITSPDRPAGARTRTLVAVALVGTVLETVVVLSR